MMCGIVRYPRRRYMEIVAFSSSIWALYCVLVGSLAGRWFEEHQFLGILVAIGAGMVLGPTIDWVLRRTLLRTPPTPSPEDDIPEEAPVRD
jgi:membrane protein DedA with SNARE-associated domain